MQEPVELSYEEITAMSNADISAYMLRISAEKLAYERWHLEQNPRTPEQQAAWEQMCRHMADKMQSGWGSTPIFSTESRPAKPETE